MNWVLDADIRGFFDNVSHDWALKFVEHRVADRRMLRLIQKWLKAGVSEDGQWSETKVGTPQGAVVSPLLANVYLHYVFDLWVEAWRKKVANGDVIVVRYADDLVVGFQHRADAERFLKGVPGAAGQVRLGITCGQDTIDRVRAVRRSKPKAAWRGKTGDLYVSGFHPLLWEDHSRRSFHRLADYGQEADGCEVESPQG